MELPPDEMTTPRQEHAGALHGAEGEPRADAPHAALPSRAVDELYSHAYEELKRLASSVRYGDAFATVTTTALVHEAWMKLPA